MAEVILDNVTRIYPGNVEAVRDVSLQVRDGEFLVLVGPSGCGKTTTLRMVAGLEEVTRGTVRIGDRDVTRMHPKDRDVAMVFQEYALYPHMTVEKNMSFGLRMRRVPRDEIRRRVADAARLLGLDELLHRKPHELSGGQRQRVAVGRAIVRQPRCALFDEPLSNLDARLRVQMRVELKALHQRLRTTTIYVTHDQEEAMTLGERVAVMADGRIQQLGAPLEVYGKPVNRFVAGFMGSRSMNLLEGTLLEMDDRLAFDDGAGLTLAIGADLARKARDHVGRPVVLGVRPEHLRPADSGADNGFCLSMPARVVEPLGDRMDVYLQARGGTQIIARVPAQTPVVAGEPLTLTADVAMLHLFEPGPFGRRIC